MRQSTIVDNVASVPFGAAGNSDSYVSQDHIGGVSASIESLVALLELKLSSQGVSGSDSIGAAAQDLKDANRKLQAALGKRESSFSPAAQMSSSAMPTNSDSDSESAAGCESDEEEKLSLASFFMDDAEKEAQKNKQGKKQKNKKKKGKKSKLNDGKAFGHTNGGGVELLDIEPDFVANERAKKVP
eukprot:TRINITY_DN13369_c0_g1_i1.p1 TRINITY_DN13369_c0_g1~~TRINITY_DN13369_c0_g1_i1.p1  ORF type:complete len:186 (+),score=51.95 TRINITY_DN13369_c0_g1_i1:92-649(+)